MTPSVSYCVFIDRELQVNKIGSATISKKHSEFVCVSVCVIKNDRVVERNSRTTRDTLQISLVMNEDGISIQFDKSKNPKQQKSI